MGDCNVWRWPHLVVLGLETQQEKRFATHSASHIALTGIYCPIHVVVRGSEVRYAAASGAANGPIIENGGDRRSR